MFDKSIVSWVISSFVRSIVHLYYSMYFSPLKSNNFENGRRKEWMDKNLGEEDHETFFMTLLHRKPIFN